MARLTAGGLGGLAEQRQAEAGLLAGLGREERVGGLVGGHVEAGSVVFDQDGELVACGRDLDVHGDDAGAGAQRVLDHLEQVERQVMHR